MVLFGGGDCTLVVVREVLEVTDALSTEALLFRLNSPIFVVGEVSVLG